MKKELRDLHLVVLMGGPGSEREVSLRSGAAVARALAEGGYRVKPLEVKGESLDLPADTGLCVNMIHGTFGEDGQLQSNLHERGIPYTGEGIAGSRTAFDKILSKEAFNRAGVPTSSWEKIRRGESPTLALPYVVKAPRQGSSVGVHIIRNAAALPAARAACVQAVRVLPDGV